MRARADETGGARAGAARRLRPPAARRDVRADWFLLVPALLFLLLFKVVPVLAVVGVSFTEWRILGGATFLGLENYRAMWGDPVFLQAFWNTLFYVAVVAPALTGSALGVALLVEELGRARHLFRLIYFIPIVVPFSLLAAMWKAAVFSSFGVVNQMIVELGFDRINFLGLTWARWAVAIVIVWAQFGLFSLMFSAGLKSIPGELHEAAKIDGATAWQRFRFITLPLLRPTTLLVVIVSTVAAFRAFDVVWVLTGGGPSYASTSLLVYVYEVGWQRFQMGYASAIALFFCVAAIGMNLVQRWALGERRHV